MQNLLDSLSGSRWEYAYDSNGRMTHDGVRGFDLQYNPLGLVEKVSHEGITAANYSYLADGMKLSVTDRHGEGLLYAGSLIYRIINGSTELESAGFSRGRFLTTSDTLQTQYYLTDHLGSVRAVVDDHGEIIERNDYYPFGNRWDNPQSPLSNNRCRYNGKELQVCGNIGWLDYGARMYDSEIGRWTTPDPLAEKYYPVSPYAYCANNPIKFVDPNGMDYYKSVAGAVIWKDLDKEKITINNEVFKNIGKSYSMRLDEASFANFYQNVFISVSSQAADARQTVLNNAALTGALLSLNSPLSPNAQQGLMTDVVRQVQGNFIAGAADYTSTVLQSTGNTMTTTGYVMMASGIGAPVGATLVSIGNTLVFTGTILDIGRDFVIGNYQKVEYNTLTNGVMLGLGKLGCFIPQQQRAIYNLIITPYNYTISYGSELLHNK